MEIKEESTPSPSDETTPLLAPEQDLVQPERVRKVGTKVPEVKVNLYRQGKGPIDVFDSSLVGWDQDQLDVRQILDNYNFKSIYAFKPGSGRGVPIRFNPRNGRSILPYKDASVINVDGEPKDSLIKPVTRILVGAAAITILIVLVLKETPQWASKLNFSGARIPPWIIASAVIVFTRLRKRTKNFLEKRR